MPGVIEHVVLGAGRALVGVAGEPVELGPGDYICYPADLPHVFEALSPGTFAVLVSEHTCGRLHDHEQKLALFARNCSRSWN